MTLDEFERQLAQEKEARGRRDRHRSEKKSEHRPQRHHHHHLHRSRSHDRDDEDGHRSKRRRRSDDGADQERRRKHQHRRERREGDKDRRDRDMKDRIGENAEEAPELKRDSWMEAPSAFDVEYVQKKKPEPSPPKAVNLGADFELKLHEKELNHHLRDLQNGKVLEDLEGQSIKHEVDYTFGDAGSQWRMTKLKGIYRLAEEAGRKVEEVALERYDSLRDFDDAREEEIELDRRKTYGKDYVGKERPSGELFQARKLDAGVRRKSADVDDEFDNVLENIRAPAPPSAALRMDQTTLNKLKAQIMKARLRKDPKADELQKQYDQAVAAANGTDPTIITLSAMDNRMLSSAPRKEVKTVQNRRGAERGQVEENEDMTIEDMVAEERRSRGQGGGEGLRLAERIAKDGKFDNDLEYMDENAAKLAKRVHKSDGALRNVAINEYQKMNQILENCPLCHHEDTSTPPIAPVVSLATRTYLTLPTQPELASFSAMIIPVEHRVNLLECDEDEWEEIRNFMKSLTRLYHDQGRDVIFYENAAHPQRKAHAGLVAVPLPYDLGETAPAFFKEAFLTTEDEWSQHKKILDTLAKAKGGLGRLAFRRTLAKEMPYFHVWFELDGGVGHVVENPGRWPKGDLFAREVIGGMLGLEPDVIKKQGRWQRGLDLRVEGFRKKWRKFDWTRVLMEGGS